MRFYWIQNKKSKFFLMIYFMIQTLFFGGLSYVLARFELGLDIQFNHFPLYLLIPALFIGIKLPTMMHNCFHENFSKYNYVIGEFTSFFVLMGFGIMCINHTLHHGFADTDSDPHNPHDKSFIAFFFTAIFSGSHIIENRYLDIHGRTLLTRSIFKLNILLHYVGIPLRLLTWFYLLGPELFLYLYVPSFFIYLFAFSHVNYITHAKNDAGETVILNKDSNLWYKLVNTLGDGVYFHKNHHQYPKLYNPKHLKDHYAKPLAQVQKRQVLLT